MCSLFCALNSRETLRMISDNLTSISETYVKTGVFQLLTFLFLLLPGFQVEHSCAQEWPAFRGSRGDGTGHSSLPKSQNVSLQVTWKKPIGSGYSSVSITDGSAFTMYTSGDEDKLGCFDIKTGETKWEFSLDAKFKGENGSFDGPISTPLVHDGNV